MNNNLSALKLIAYTIPNCLNPLYLLFITVDRQPHTWGESKDLDDFAALSPKDDYLTIKNILLIDCSTSLFTPTSIKKLQKMLQRAHCCVNTMQWINHDACIRKDHFDLVIVGVVSEPNEPAESASNLEKLRQVGSALHPTSHTSPVIAFLDRRNINFVSILCFQMFRLSCVYCILYDRGLCGFLGAQDIMIYLRVLALLKELKAHYSSGALSNLFISQHESYLMLTNLIKVCFVVTSFHPQLILLYYKAQFHPKKHFYHHFLQCFLRFEMFLIKLHKTILLLLSFLLLTYCDIIIIFKL